MTKGDLIFDWGVSESRFRDKLVAVLVVVVFFTFVIGSLNIRFNSAYESSRKAASVIRFGSEDLANRWLQVAEEGGPNPGKMNFEGSMPGADPASIFAMSDPSVDREYDVPLRGFVPDFEVARLELARKGFRVFPKISESEEVSPPPAASDVSGAKQPVLTPYDEAAIEWMPKELPVFSVEDGTDTSGSPWRFALALRGDGTVRDCISLGGGEAGLEQISAWLRGVKFGAGENDRWLGLRVELINRRADGSGTE